MRHIRNVFAGLAIASVLFGCGSKEKTGDASSAGNGKSVVIWHWMTDREEAFKELAKRYKEKTGNDVDFQLYAPSDAYSQKVRVGAQTNSLPDIFGVLGDARDMSIFIEAGHIADLTADLNQNNWKDSFYPEALNTAHYKAGNQFNVPEGYYGIPIDVTTIPMIFNKKLFQKAGLDPNNPPATWADFIAAGKKLKAAGVNGFVSGWGEIWLIYSMGTDLAFNVMGNDKVMDTFRGKVPYTDADWVKVFQAFADMQKAGFADSSLVTLDNKRAEQAFAQERSGFTFNGSWAVNVYAGMNPQLEYGVMRVPALSPAHPRTVWGGAGTVFHVNAKSPNKQTAIDFLRWMSEPEQAAFLVEKTKNLPAVKNVGENIPPILKDFAATMTDSIHPNRFDVTEQPKVQEAFSKGIQSILIGEKTPEQVAQQVQKVKAKSAK